MADDAKIQEADEKEKPNVKLGCGILAGLLVFVLIALGMCVALGDELSGYPERFNNSADRFDFLVGNGNGEYEGDEQVRTTAMCEQYLVDGRDSAAFSQSVRNGIHAYGEYGRELTDTAVARADGDILYVARACEQLFRIIIDGKQP